MLKNNYNKKGYTIFTLGIKKILQYYYKFAS